MYNLYDQAGLYSAEWHVVVSTYLPEICCVEKSLVQWWILKSNLCPMLEICALHTSYLHKFTLTWHHAFTLCAQLIAFSPGFG
jgi:DMSO reductase anchor subunit